MLTCFSPRSSRRAAMAARSTRRCGPAGIGVDHLPFALPFRPYVRKAKPRCVGLAVAHAMCVGHAAEDRTISPDSHHSLLDGKWLEGEAGRGIIADEIGLAFMLALRVDQLVIVGEQRAQRG